MSEFVLRPLQKDLIKFLEKNGPQTRADIVRSLNKPRTTVYENLEGLMIHEVVRRYSRPTNTRGRPLVFFKVVEEKVEMIPKETLSNPTS